MKFDIMRLIRNSLLVSFMLGSSAFIFNDVYAATKSTSSSSTSVSSTLTAEEAKVIKNCQKSIAEEYSKWLETDAGKNASDKEKTAKNLELTSDAYDKLSASDKKLFDSGLAKLSEEDSSKKGSSKKGSSKKGSSKKESSNSSSSKSTTKTASAKTKTGDPCSISMLGLSLLGSLGTCVLYCKKQ